MKKKEDIQFFQQNSRSLYVTLIVCLIVFIISISVLIFAFNRLISDHDQYLSGEMCTLFSEKVNNSIDSMTESIRSVSDVLTAQKYESPEEIYKKLVNYNGFDYLSVGFIDENGRIFASEDERAEFKKWNLLETAYATNDVSMSIPYRSTVYGQHVITMFSDFEYGQAQHGYIFMTYLFKDLQDVVATESMVNDIEIMFINAESANIITCVSSDEQTVSNWTNAYLVVSDINKSGREDYLDSLVRMSNGDNDIGLNYSIGDISYSQYSSAVPSMPGWYVSVRIPGNALSSTMHTFRNYVLIFTVVLLVVVIILIVNMYRLSKRQNKILERLSIYDPLTGVFNRRAFDYAAQTMLVHGRKCAIMFFDIDYFKQVNDQFGHDAGDKLLKLFASILKKYFEGNGIVSRFGGDEFVVLTEMVSVEDVSVRLLAAARDLHAAGAIEPVQGGKKRVISFSAGVAQYPLDSDELSGLKKCADTALYQVKEHGRNGYGWYKA